MFNFLFKIYCYCEYDLATDWLIFRTRWKLKIKNYYIPALLANGALPMINYPIHSDGRKEFIGEPKEVTVKYNYVPTNTSIGSRAVIRLGSKKITKCSMHRFPCELYCIQFSNNGWNALPGLWNVSLRMIEGD